MKKDIQVIRESIGKIVALLTKQSIKVTQRGTKAFVQYHAKTGSVLLVNIPYLPDDASEDFIAAVQGFLDHEVGHVLDTDPAILLEAAKGGKRLANLHNVIEDVRIERRMTERFPGSVDTLSAVRKFYLEKIAKPKIMEALARGDAKAAAGFASVVQFRAWGGQTIAQDFLRDNPKVAELAKPMAEKLGPELIARMLSLKSPKDALEVARLYKTRLEEPEAPEEMAPPSACGEKSEPSKTPEKGGDEPGEDTEAKEDKGSSTTEADEGDKKREDGPSSTEEETDEAGEHGGESGESASGEHDDADKDSGEKEKPESKPEERDDAPTPTEGEAPEEGAPEESGKPSDEESAPKDEPAEGDDSDADESDTDDTGGDDTEADPDGDDGDKDGESTGGMGDSEADEEDEADAGSGASAKDGDESDGADEDPSDDGAKGKDGEDDVPASSDPGPTDKGEPDGGDREESPTEDELGSIFDEERDFDDAMSEALTKEAKKEISASDYRIFSTDWDTIDEAPMARKTEAPGELVDKTRHMVATIQKQLERAMAAKARVMWNPGQRRGRIAPGNLFRTAVGDDRVFRTRTETRAKQTAVSLLIDCSGSMKAYDRIGMAGVAAFALSSTLERLKVKHEVIGFTSKRSAALHAAMSAEGMGVRYSREQAIYMPVFKRWDERLGVEATSRMAHLTENPGWLCENIDGESVQIAAHRLQQQRAERHILIVLSDGDPACPGDYAALDRHLKSVVSKIEADKRVEIVGIGIQSRAVAQFYKKSLVLNNLEDLPTTVVSELTKLLLAE